MKGISKALARTPHLVTTKVGMSKKSADPEFDDYQRQFGSLEDATQKLLKDCGALSAAVLTLLSSGQGFATGFANLFQPMAGEIDVLGKHPEARNTMQNADLYQNAMEELRSTLSPELELIESRIVGPCKEHQAVLKTIRKNIVKREHKLVDFDRYNNSLTKLRDKKEKSLNDEKNLFKLEQDFEVASNEYDAINMAMKSELPRFLTLATQFIDPLFHSFYYMQLNIFYLMLEKLQGFAQGKYDLSGSGEDIVQGYESSRSDAAEHIEAMGIVKRAVSSAKLMQQSRQASGGTTATSVSRTASSSSAAFAKKPPPPPPGSSAVAAPPPYTPSGGAANAAAGKKAPPPPPPMKAKPPVSEPPKAFVVALYDFAAQADGDLDFRVGDRIELVEKTASSEDWWTGRINGKQGVFPGNYVQEG